MRLIILPCGVISNKDTGAWSMARRTLKSITLDKFSKPGNRNRVIPNTEKTEKEKGKLVTYVECKNQSNNESMFRHLCNILSEPLSTHPVHMVGPFYNYQILNIYVWNSCMIHRNAIYLEYMSWLILKLFTKVKRVTYVEILQILHIPLVYMQFVVLQ